MSTNTQIMTVFGALVLVAIIGVIYLNTSGPSSPTATAPTSTTATAPASPNQQTPPAGTSGTGGAAQK